MVNLRSKAKRVVSEVTQMICQNVQDTTLSYYDNYAEEFYKSTVTAEFAATQERFLAKLPPNALILDFGCGSGRDTKYFLMRGYRVDAIDGSEKLCKLASQHTGIQVKQMLFEELSAVRKYDGIWACSSILHLPAVKLTDVMHKMSEALKRNGIVYTSFKYGTFAGERNGRYFTDMTETTFAELLVGFRDLTVEEQWVSSDVRPERSEEKWLNLILRKR